MGWRTSVGLGVAVGAAAFLFSPRREIPAVPAPVARPAQRAVSSENVSASPAGARGESASERLESPANRGALFEFLFSADFATWITRDPGAPAVVSRRLARPYPADDGGEHHASPRERELAVRIGILRALAAHRVPALRDAYVQRLVDPGEHWLVKRQALRGFQANGDTFHSEADRDAILAGLDPRVIATSPLSDTELIERAAHASQ